MKNIEVFNVYINATEVKSNTYKDIVVKYPHKVKKILGAVVCLASNQGAEKYGQISATTVIGWGLEQGKIRIYNNSNSDRSPSASVLVLAQY